MNSKVLLVLGAVLLASATLYLTLHRPQKNHEVVIYPTRDDLSTCTIRKCYHSGWECQSDHTCMDEGAVLNQKYMNDPKNFEKIFSDIKSSILLEFIQCQRSCGVFDYLKRCAVEDVYLKKCFTNPESECQKDNKDYFDNLKNCQTRKYKACDNLTDKEAYYQCLSQEQIWCASDGLGEFKGQFNEAMYCV